MKFNLKANGNVNVSNENMGKLLRPPLIRLVFNLKIFNMKTNILFLGIALCFSVSFFSCSDDEQMPSRIQQSEISTFFQLANDVAKSKLVVQDAPKGNRADANGTTTISVVFPGGGTTEELQAVEAVQTPEDLVLLYDRTAADFYYPEANVEGDTTITFSDKDAIEALEPLVAESKNVLHKYGFSDTEIQEMLDENGVDETQLVMLMMAIVNNEIEPEYSFQAMASKRGDSFGIINNTLNHFETVLSDLLFTPLYANQSRTSTHGDLVSYMTNQEFKVVVGCAVKALVMDIAFKALSKALLKKAFVAIAKKVLGPVGVAIAVADFGWCLHVNGVI